MIIELQQCYTLDPEIIEIESAWIHNIELKHKFTIMPIEKSFDYLSIAIAYITSQRNIINNQITIPLNDYTILYNTHIVGIAIEIDNIYYLALRLPKKGF